jgi:NYN domain
MKLSIFIEDHAFFAGWREAGQGRRLHFPMLAEWIRQQVGATMMTGVHYYAGVDPLVPDATEGATRRHGFLDMLDQQPGFFVHRFSRLSQKHMCIKCGSENRIPQHQEVDLAMAVDAMRGAAVGALDVAVVLSSNPSLLLLCDGLHAVGKQLIVAGWSNQEIPARLKRAAFATLDLSSGLEQFEQRGGDDPGREARIDQPHDRTEPPMVLSPEAVFVAELANAEERFAGGYVGLGYFVTRWRSHVLDANPDTRRRLLDALVQSGRVELYAAVDGAQAIRVVTPASPSVTTTLAAS